MTGCKPMTTEDWRLFREHSEALGRRAAQLRQEAAREAAKAAEKKVQK